MKKILTDDKVLIFSDIHWGKDKDSDLYNDLDLSVIDEVIKICSDNYIKTVFFLGDWFDSRKAVSVKTLCCAYFALTKLHKHNIDIYLILGNHDIYFKNKKDVNSIRNYAELPNVHPIVENTEIEFKSCDKKVMLMPWGDITESSTEKYDALFGHFEFIGAKLMGMTSDKGCDPSQLLSFSPLVFSGHYHLRNEYNYKNGKIVTVGSPFELDWGDYQNKKCMYILDMHTLKYQEVETTGPKHIKIYWSNLLNNDKSDLNNIKGNFVQFVVDAEYKYEKILKMCEYINKQNPLLPCEIVYLYKPVLRDIINSENLDEELLKKSRLEQLEIFINKNSVDGLDKKKLMEYSSTYYQFVVQKIGEEI